MADRFKWKQEYETGNARVDAEHQELLRLGNKLFASLAAHKGADVAEEMLDAFVDYAATHFRHEEEAMAERGCKALPGHKKEHEALAQEILALKDEDMLGFIETADVVAEWVETRLVPHMTIDDMRVFKG